MTAAPRGGGGSGRTVGVSDDVILDAAFDAFAEHGFDATSVREVGRSLGISHNTIPQRFGTKQRLWFAAVDHVLGGMAAELVTALEQAPAEGLERLRWMMRAFLVLNSGRPSGLRLIAAEAATPGPRLDHLLDRLVGPAVSLARTLLTDLHRAGQVRTDDVALVYFLMVHAAASPLVHDPLYRRLGGTADVADPAGVEAWADHVTDLLLGGLATAG